jgi:ADP-ribose pyrophosphatase
MASLDAYDELLRVHPELGRGREMRPIVTDRIARERFVAETGTPLGIIAETPYFYVLTDLVASGVEGELPFPYVRVVLRKQLAGAPGVAIVARIANPSLGNPGDVVLLRQERHAMGGLELEIPRGFGEPGETSADAALRELVEETGYVGVRPREIGEIVPDSGIQDGCVKIFQVDVVDRGVARRERQEAIAEVTLMPAKSLAESIRRGTCRDSFTIAGLWHMLDANANANAEPFVVYDHVQLAMPPGDEDRARAFYAGVLGMTELPKPEELRARGGAWFASGAVQLHLGVETAFAPARKAHPALRCSDMDALLVRLEVAGCDVTHAGTFEDGARHAYVDDPFGNRLELIG